MISNKFAAVLVVTVVAASAGASAAVAQTAPSLGAAESFAVAAGSTVTNTGPTSIVGNLGVSPGSAVTGFPPGVVVGGTIHAANATALAAQTSITTAYNALAAQSCTQTLTGTDLGGLILTPGVYCFATSAQLTGTLTLNAQGNPSAVFIFKIGSTLTTASSASVQMTNGGSPCNVFWQVGSSATLGTTTSFLGSILALTSITLTTGANVTGRALARNGAVTLDSNVVSASACSTAVPGPTPPGPCPGITISPATLPNPTVGLPYSITVSGSGGTGPYTLTLVSGTLPAGLALSPTGVSGTPTTAGTSSFVIRLTDAAGCFAEVPVSMTVVTAVPTLPQIFVGLLALGLGVAGYQQIRRRSRVI